MKDLEYKRLPEEIVFPAQEMVHPPQEVTLLPEETPLMPENPSGMPELLLTEQGKSLTNDKKKKNRLKLLKGMVQLAASVTVATLTFQAASPHIPTHSEDVPRPSKEWEPTQQAPIQGETGDDAFPILSNLEPVLGIPEPNFSGMSEEYIRFLNQDTLGTTAVYLIAGDVWDASIEEVPGASYDLSTNTLTLENFHGQMLDVNLMGNGFTINLIGDSFLEHIKIWGWNYGGSLTITGSGCLTVNQDNRNEVGIELDGEGSETCLMVDNTATLDVRGSVLAIYIHSSTLEKTIYYRKPMTIIGGTRDYGRLYVESDEQLLTINVYTVVDEDKKPATHVIFSP